MNPPRILIIDDEENIRFVLERALRRAGYVLDSAANGAEALQKLNNAALPYDLLILDLQMQPVDGLPVLQAAIEQDPDVIVIILTAHGTLESAVEALRLGAFDYLFKPATPEAIRRRVSEGLQKRRRALQRRRLLKQIDLLRQTLNELDSADDPLASSTLETRFLRSGPLTIDRRHRQAAMSDKPVELTTTEFDILYTLAAASPTPITPRDLLNRALGYDADEQEARDIIKWHIHRLRRKIDPASAPSSHIKTIRHKGYLWSP
ncbi:MAG TPA: response regulator transcription factor [Anaerolineae bacterium]|nr:response regulator transcription factor [Anaerolineae bacterium]